MKTSNILKLASDFEFLSAKPANQNRLNLGKITIDFIDADNTNVALLRNTALLQNFGLAEEIAKKIVSQTLADNGWEELDSSFDLQEPWHLVGEVMVKKKLRIVE